MDVVKHPHVRWVQRGSRYVLQYLVERVTWRTDPGGAAQVPQDSEWQDVPVVDPKNPGVYEYPYGGPVGTVPMREDDRTLTHDGVQNAVESLMREIRTAAMTLRVQPVHSEQRAKDLITTDKELRDRLHELETVAASDAVQEAAAIKERAEIAEKALADYTGSLTLLRQGLADNGCEVVDATDGTGLWVRNKRAEDLEKKIERDAQRTMREHDVWQKAQQRLEKLVKILDDVAATVVKHNGEAAVPYDSLPGWLNRRLSYLERQHAADTERIAELERQLHDIESTSTAEAVQEAAAYEERAEVAERAVASLKLDLARQENANATTNLRADTAEKDLQECEGRVLHLKDCNVKLGSKVKELDEKSRRMMLQLAGVREALR